MIEIREALTKKMQKEFIEFPLKMYKDCPYFVPPFYGDEKSIFKKEYVYSDTCDTVYYNAYRDGKMVGRISGIIQRSANEKNNEKRVRFTRFDSTDDVEVAKALFSAMENWAKGHGMDTACGPLGFSDLEREGLLIEGFDQLSTFEEQYNYEYYGKLIEACGYAKEVDWVESMVRAPKEPDEKLLNMSEVILKRNNLKIATYKSARELLRRYADDVFELIDLGYDHLYGTVPFTDAMKKNMISNFLLIIRPENVQVIVDENDKAVCFGLCFPSIAKAIQPSGGRLMPLALIRLLHTINHPEVIDLGLIAVHPDYIKKGIGAVVSAYLMKMLIENRDKIDHAETNLNLEDNFIIRNMWKRFDSTEHKKRRCYVKKLTEEE